MSPWIRFSIALLLGCSGGYLLDRWLQSAPWLTFLGSFLGLSAGIVSAERAAGRRH